ncbi:hypothetical protein BB776_00255 [Planococcus salinarum]|uniref:Uncharacterized protein n=1 Tax=Planococcus salinarum TaxID=622695 RepID=A0ABX3D250_9BACL|nr:hypothetical protein BB776_00255 [Planococcus salinarum]
MGMDSTTLTPKAIQAENIIFSYAQKKQEGGDLAFLLVLCYYLEEFWLFQKGASHYAQRSV